MYVGLILPNKRPGANPEVILATAQAAERIGWRSLWADDHILVPNDAPSTYRHLYELMTTMAWLGGQTERIRLGMSVLIVPQRNAVITAKELATLDELTGARVVAGVGLGSNVKEYAYLGMSDRLRVRGAYLDEAIALWRHLWSGTGEPFVGRFHRITDAVMSPLPAQGASLPIIVGGRSDHGVIRAGRVGDGYQLSQNSPRGMAARLPLLRATAAETGRATPPISARVPIYFGPPPPGATAAAIHGTAEEIARVVDEWREIGLDELAIDLDETDTDRAVAKLQRIHEEVLDGRVELVTAAGG